MEYRTEKQFEEIIESATNGNWSQAAEECVEYGYYANDLIKRYEQYKEEYGGFQYFQESDIAILSEMATEIRYKQEWYNELWNM